MLEFFTVLVHQLNHMDFDKWVEIGKDFVRDMEGETYGLDDRFAKDADGNTIVIAKVGDPKP